MEKQKYLLFDARLKKALPSLSSAERQVGDYILANPEKVIDGTTRTISEEAGVSTATVVRFCRSCGFEGLTDLKLSLRREQKQLLETEKSAKYVNVQKDDSIQMIKQKILGYHDMIVQHMLSNWNVDAYTFAAGAITDARHVLIMGEGGSRCSALCLFYTLTNLGIDCAFYEDSVFEIMKVGQLGKEDVAIGITYTGRLKNTIDSLKLAKERGATTIGLIGNSESPAVDNVDIFLKTTEITKDYYDSALSIRISENVVIEILSMLIAMRLDKAIEPTVSGDHIISIRRIKESEYSNIEED